MRPRLLDLFSGAGGAGMGYSRAGFDVTGVDRRPQPRYPFTFHQADAMAVLRGETEIDPGSFDVIHASPPCQAYSRAAILAGSKRSTVDLVPDVRTLLEAIGRPWVIENVEGAPVSGLMLCGSAFDLQVRRHRLFESTQWLGGPGVCQHARQGRPIGVYGRMGDQVKGTDSTTGLMVFGGLTAHDIEAARIAMGIDWMVWEEIKEAIPPAYTEWIGRQLISHLEARPTLTPSRQPQQPA